MCARIPNRAQILSSLCLNPIRIVGSSVILQCDIFVVISLELLKYRIRASHSLINKLILALKPCDDSRSRLIDDKKTSSHEHIICRFESFLIFWWKKSKRSANLIFTIDFEDFSDNEVICEMICIKLNKVSAWEVKDARSSVSVERLCNSMCENRGSSICYKFCSISVSSLLYWRKKNVYCTIW